MFNFWVKSKFSALFLTVIMLSGTITCFAAATTYAPVSSGGGPMYGGNRDDAGYSIKLTSDVGLIFAGYTRSFGCGGSDMWLLKTAPESYKTENGGSGSFQKEKWNATYGGSNDDAASAVIQTSDGGFAAAGYTRSFGAGGSDMYLVKVNPQGTLQWSKTYGGAGDDAANCLIQTGDGGYLLAGYTNSDVDSKTAWVVKTDSSGEIVWEKTFAGTAANSVVAAGDGYAFAIESAASFGLVTTDSSGNICMTRTYPAPEAVASTQSVAASDDGYALAGWLAQDATGNHDSWLIKVDSAGEQQWSRTISGVGAYSVIKMSSGGYALTGDRAALILTDSAGSVDWSQMYDGNTSNDTKYMSKYPAVMREVIEASPNHFVLVGQQKSGLNGDWQMSWNQVALKSGAQTIPPEVTITSPECKAYTQRDIPLTFHVNERVNHMMYSLNGGLNTTINGNMTLSNLPDDEYSILVFATDLEGNTGVSQYVTFSVSSSEPYNAPKVTIESPKNGSVLSSQVTLRFSVDQQITWYAYSLDGGPKHLAVPDGNFMIFVQESGNHTLTVYAGQTEESAGSASVTFNTYESYATTFPSTDTNAVLSVLGLSLLFSPIFVTIIGVFLIVSVCALVIAIYVARKTAVKEAGNR